MVYDGDGNRVSKTAGGVTTVYLVDDGNPTGLPQVVEELSSGGVVQKRYLYGLQRIAQTQVAAAATSFYGYDGHGDVRYLMDVTGAVTDTYDYDAFGNVVATTGTTANVYRYQGEAFDAETGLYYLRARYYDPVVGRFLSVDPLADQGEHPYEYAGADPVNGHDPTGTQDIIENDLLKDFWTPRVLDFNAMENDIKCLMGVTLSLIESPGLEMEREAGCRARVVSHYDGYTHPGLPGLPSKGGCCEKALKESISTFLKGKTLLTWDTSLADHLVSEGAQVDVDPRLIVAITGLESNFGASKATRVDNNPFGLVHGKYDNPVPNHYDSALLAIQSEGATLKRFIHTWGEGSVSDLYSGRKWIVDPKAPWKTLQYPGYCSHAGCPLGIGTVSGYLTAQRGNPAQELRDADPNNLTYPCQK